MSRLSNFANITARGLGYAYAKAERKLDRPLYTDANQIYSNVTTLADIQRGAENLAMNSAYFYANITALARKASVPKLNVLRIEGEGTEHLYDHPFEKLFRRPNPLFDRAALMKFSVVWLALNGNAYWWKTMVGKELVELWPLPADEVKAVPHKTKVISHYTWQPAGKQMPPIPAEKIVHFRLVNPFSILHGRGLILALKYTLQGNEARMKWNRDFFSINRAMPEGALSVDPMTTQADVDTLREELIARHGGGQRRIAVFRAGEIDFERFALTQEEMDFLSGMRFDGELIDRVCGFPGGYWDAKANRANAEQAERSLARDTITPILAGFASAIDAQIIDCDYEHEGEDLTCAFDSVVPEDRDLAVREFEIYRDVRTLDEAREMLDLPPLGGELGATPYLLVPALGQMMTMGLAPVPAPPAKRADMRDDLRKWRRVVAKAVAKGGTPRRFFSDVIPGDIAAGIVEKLIDVTVLVYRT